MTSLCVFHRADFDGVCSAAIVKKFVPDCELYGIDYGDPFPWDKAASRLGPPERTPSRRPTAWPSGWAGPWRKRGRGYEIGLENQ